MGGLGEVIAMGAAEEVAPAQEIVPEASVAPAPAPSAAPGDDLGRLKGVGPKLVAALNAMGVTRYAQIAAWNEADVARVDAALPPAFQGRITRDNWIEQARFLAGGDVTGYEAKFGKL
jgi:predicted flap endonuclease-1-like 5' DNA nuclease